MFTTNTLPNSTGTTLCTLLSLHKLTPAFLFLFFCSSSNHHHHHHHPRRRLLSPASSSPSLSYQLCPTSCKSPRSFIVSTFRYFSLSLISSQCFEYHRHHYHCRWSYLISRATLCGFPVQFLSLSLSFTLSFFSLLSSSRYLHYLTDRIANTQAHMEQHTLWHNCAFGWLCV